MIARLLREPLVFFLLLGAVIFAVDAWLNGSRITDDSTIRVTRQHLDALRVNFSNEHGRPPADEELHASLRGWLDEQMLYRQALALGLEQNDAIVRRQLVQKMRFLLEDAVPVDEPDEQALEAWLEKHPERYGKAPTVSFDQLFFSRSKYGGDSGDAVLLMLERLRAGSDVPGSNRIDNVDHGRLRRDFGNQFADAVMQLPDNEWQGPLRSGLGLHLVRIVDRSDFVPATLAQVRDRVRNDLRLHLREQANQEAMQRLRRRFRIEFEDAANSGTGG